MFHCLDRRFGLSWPHTLGIILPLFQDFDLVRDSKHKDTYLTSIFITRCIEELREEDEKPHLRFGRGKGKY